MHSSKLRLYCILFSNVTYIQIDSHTQLMCTISMERNVSSPFRMFVCLFFCLFVCLFVCSGLTSLLTLSVISRRCLVVTGSSMLTFIVLPHCGIRSQTLLPDTTSSHIILTPERPVLVLPRKFECQAGSN